MNSIAVAEGGSVPDTEWLKLRKQGWPDGMSVILEVVQQDDTNIWISIEGPNSLFPFNSGDTLLLLKILNGGFRYKLFRVRCCVADFHE